MLPVASSFASEALTYSNVDPLFIVDMRQQVVAWSSGAENLLGYQADEVLGKPCYLAIRGCNEHGMRICVRACPAVRQAALGRMHPGYLMQLPTQWGTDVVAHVVHVVVRGHDGHPGILHVIVDTTEAARTSEMLKDLREATNPNLRPERRAVLSALLLEQLPLTRREREVLLLLMQGSSPDGIAASLAVTLTTVKNHLQNILVKLGSHSRGQAVCLAFRECLREAWRGG